MSLIKSGATSDYLTIDPTSNAARCTVYSTGGRRLTGHQSTYSAANTFNLAASATEIVRISGSSTNTIYVHSFVLSYQGSVAASRTMNLNKSNALSTGGTSIPCTTVVSHDSSNPVQSATVLHWTASPSVVASNNINKMSVAAPVVVPGAFVGITRNPQTELLPKVNGIVKPVVLRGVNECLVVNMLTAITFFDICAYRVLWTEESS